MTHHGQTITKRALLGLAAVRWLLANLTAADVGPPALSLSSPRDYQVQQRTSRESGTVTVAGALSEPARVGDGLEVRVTVGGVPGAWQARSGLQVGQQEFRIPLPVAAGGWHRLEVRVQQGERTVATRAVEHLGVGEVFVVAGQSNSANHGEERQPVRSGLVSAMAGDHWQLALDPQPGASGTGGSFMPPLGDALAAQLKVPIGFVATGVGATSVREWLPRGARFPNPPTLTGNVTQRPDGEWESSGQLFNRFVDRVRGLGPQGFRAVLWHQGESDANQRAAGRTLPGARYREFMEQLIRATRREAGWEMPWFVAQVSYHTPDDTGSPDLRAAQAALWQAGAALEGPDTDALVGELRDNGGSGVHFSGPGLREHAARWAKKILPWLELQLARTTAAKTHWSLQPIRRPVVPAGMHPVDAFILATLRTNGLPPSPPAAPRDLVRRVYFDLLGLPPAPEEVAAFERDRAPDRFEKMVDRLLASPRYGERWARHWLDVVRYTESQGFEYDRARDHAWPYRDYVIRSFNADQPYDRFMREQIAGDVLEPVTGEGIVAASLLVCGPWDQAGNSQANATQRALTREEELEDLISVVGQTFLGLTVNCARCHDHKFDPIPITDYYRVKSVFDGVRHGDRSMEGAAETRAREDRRARVQEELAAAQTEVSRIEAAGANAAAQAQPPTAHESGPAALARWRFDGTAAGTMPGELKGGASRSGGRLLLPQAGAYFQTAPLPRDLREKTLEAWVALATLDQGGGAAISLESADGHQFDALVFGERQPKKWAAGSEGFARTRDVAAPEETAPPETSVQLVAVYSADNRIALYRNGAPYGRPYSAGPLATFKAGDARITLGRRHQDGGRPWLTGTIQQAALYDRALTPAEVASSFRAGGFVIPQSEILARLTADQKAARLGALARVVQARAELAAAGTTGPLAYAGRREQPAPTKVLLRGDVKKPGDVVSPAGLSALAMVKADFGLAPDAPEADRRLKFAAWLADPQNPLPARVMVNRVWQFHFGQGLVTTPSDFGANGVRPSHPELLDWLASEFIASGWSVKALHRLILTSATYRQSSGETGHGPMSKNYSGRSGNTGRLKTGSPLADPFQRAAAQDADNTLLWRFPPRRLEAEAVRDAMLAISGQLNPQFGGPSFRPFTTTEYGATFYHLFDRGDAEFNRRTIYRMNINSGKEPLLDAFDCPDPSVKTPRRGVTTTPLQALSVMNGTFVQRQAAQLAERAQGLAGNNVARAVEAAYRLALGRPATPSEHAQAETAVRERGLASVCWVLLNSTEFVYVR